MSREPGLHWTSLLAHRPLLSLSLPICEVGEGTEDGGNVGLAAPAGMQEELVLDVWGGSLQKGERVSTPVCLSVKEN